MDDLGFEEVSQDELDGMGFEEVKDKGVQEEVEKQEGSFLNDLQKDPVNTALDAVGNVGTFFEGIGRGIPVAGKALEDTGAMIAGMTPEQGQQALANVDEQSPWLTGGGKMAGAMGSFAAAPGLRPALALSAADMVTRDKTAGEMAVGLALEGTLGGVGKLIGKGLGGLSSDKLAARAEKNAIEALDPSSEQIGKMMDEGTLLEKGRYLLDNNILRDPSKNVISGLRDKEEMLSVLNANKDKLVGKLKKSTDDITEAGPDVPGRLDLAEKLKGMAGKQRDTLLDDTTAKYYDKASNSFKTPEIKEAEKAIKELDQIARDMPDPDILSELGAMKAGLQDGIEEAQALDFKDLADIRQYLDGKAESAFKSQSKSTDHIRKVAGAVREIEDEIAMGIDPDYKTIKKLLGQTKDLNKMAKSAAGKAEREALGGISQTINRSMPTILGTTVGAATGNPIAAVAGAAVGNRAGKVWAKYGPQFKAAGFENASKLTKDSEKLKKLIEAVEKGGSTAVGALHFKYMLEDESYRKNHTKKEDK